MGRIAGPPWEEVETFLSVMRVGSLSGAARELGVSHPTVRRRIRSLEETLGTPLFTRSANGLRPTETAAAVLPLAESMEGAGRSLVRVASADSDSLAGTVRIAASVLMAAEILPPILARLHHAHPDLAVELVVSNRVVDLDRRDADIAVRMAPLVGSTLVARRLGALPLGFFASPGYLERHPAPASLADLRDHTLVGYDADPQILDALAALGLSLARRDVAFRCDDDVACLAAIRAGVGIGITYAAFAGDLVRVLPAFTRPVDVWVVAHEDLRAVRRIRVTLDHLVAQLGDYVRAG